MTPNIFLTGFSGTGKTTIGRKAARILSWRFVDLDECIEADAGKSIDAIFAEHGEPHFRALEAQTLLAACKSERQVVSTGGGIAESADNRTAMMQHGAVVCLEASPETIYERVLAQSTGDDAIVRPMLAADDPSGPHPFLEVPAPTELYSCSLDSSHRHTVARAGGARSRPRVRHTQRQQGRDMLESLS